VYDKKLKQIKEKYKAPDYRPPKPKVSEYTTISYALIALGLSAVATIYFFLIEGNKQGDGFILPCCATSLLFVILASRVVQEFKKTDIVHLTEVPGAMAVHGAAILMGLLAFWAVWNESPDEWVGFYCCSTLLLFFIPIFSLDIKGTAEEQNRKLEEKKIRRDREAEQHKNAWEKAQKHEEHNQFDEAEKIWLQFGEKEEVIRVGKLKIGYLHITLEQRIQELKERGIDTAQLEEQLAHLERNPIFLELSNS